MSQGGVMRLWVLLVLAGSAIAMASDFNFNNRKISSVGIRSSKNRYAVVFDAGSSGSRVHVYQFNSDLDLLPIGEDSFEVFVTTKPGLSSYGDDPAMAAASLVPLLDEAERAVPPELHSNTPIFLGATAGLRLLEGDRADKILEAVRELFKKRSTFKYDAEAVTILNGSQEGSYMWVTINFLKEILGKKYSNTIGVIDLGGGSVQMAYAISKDEAANAPKAPDNDGNPYVQQFYLKGANYFLYVHSYLNYGLMAARAEILKVTKDSTNPCILAGYQGSYEYNGKQYKTSASPNGSSFKLCRKVILEAIKANKPCNYNSSCSFDGIWNGGGGVGENNLYVASFFYDKAVQTDLVDGKKKEAVVRPVDFKKAANHACKTKYADAMAAFPNLYHSDLQFVCMDMVYEYVLLVDGFGIHPQKEITLVNQIKYRGSFVEVAWPLGNALIAVSSSSYLNNDHQSN